MDLEGLDQFFDGHKPLDILRDMDSYLQKKYGESLYNFFVVTNYTEELLHQELAEGFSAKEIIDKYME